MTADNAYDLMELAAKREREKWERLVLPEDFWQSRMDLDMIRSAARKRQVAPDAALGACLARVTTIADWRLRLPPTRGYPSPLGVWGLLTGSSAAAKSTAMRVAAALLPDAPEWHRTTAPASGEALIAAMWDERENEHGKPEAYRAHHAAIVGFDEGTLLTKLASRQGNTLVGMLLTAYNGGQLGTDTLITAKRGQSRTLAQASYNFAVLIAIQPEAAEPLLAEASVGLIQRFVWFSTIDLAPSRAVGIDRSINPLPWSQPVIRDLRERLGEDGTYYIRYPLEVETEVVNAGGDALEPWHHADPLDGHLILCRLRVAAGFALLDGRIDLNMEDWQFAGMVMERSNLQRTAVIEAANARATARTEAAIEQHAAGIVTAEQVREERTITNGMDSAMRKLRKSGRMTKGILRNGLSTAQRAHFPEILHRLEEDNLIVLDGDSVEAR